MSGVSAVVRRPSPYRSSHPLDELTVTLRGGAEVTLALKRLGRAASGPDGELAQPRFLQDPQREPAVYRSVLMHGPAGPPAHVGSLAGPQDERWLFIEWVRGGRELCQIGDAATWDAAARWLGRFHAAMAGSVDTHAQRGRLIAYDAAYYRVWPRRARDFARARGRTSEAAHFLDWLAPRHDAVIEALLALPRTVVHGDFNAANVIVAAAPGGGPVRIAPVDWELAGSGPGLVDLATLVSGGWSAPERERLAAAYAGAAGGAAVATRELAFARLHVALRWLGWAPPGWAPPPRQRHDWLADAIVLTQELGL